LVVGEIALEAVSQIHNLCVRICSVQYENLQWDCSVRNFHLKLCHKYTTFIENLQCAVWEFAV
jgi:hypothetical protein